MVLTYRRLFMGMLTLIAFGVTMLLSQPSLAGFRSPIGSLSLMGSYSKSSLGTNSYSTSKRYTATIGMNLTSVTEIELGYSYADTFFNYDPVQTTSVNEQSLSLSLVQTLVPPSWFFQPYAKGGLAQYNRRQSGTIYGTPTATTTTKSPSALAGGGIRLFLLRNFSLKVELVTYLPNFRFADGKDNFYFQGGVGWNF